MTFTFITAEKDGKTNRDRVHGDKCTGQRTKKLLKQCLQHFDSGLFIPTIQTAVNKCLIYFDV